MPTQICELAIRRRGTSPSESKPFVLNDHVYSHLTLAAQLHRLGDPARIKFVANYNAHVERYAGGSLWCHHLLFIYFLFRILTNRTLQVFGD